VEFANDDPTSVLKQELSRSAHGVRLDV
jgi:hypothetical protein